MEVISWWMHQMTTYILQTAESEHKVTMKAQIWEHRQLQVHQTLLTNKTVSNFNGPQDKLPYIKKTKIRSVMVSRRSAERKNLSIALLNTRNACIIIHLRLMCQTQEMNLWGNWERVILNKRDLGVTSHKRLIAWCQRWTNQVRYWCESTVLPIPCLHLLNMLTANRSIPTISPRCKSL